MPRRKGMKRQDYRTRVAKTLNFEEHIFSDFEELCKEENVYPSHKLQELIIGELEKKVVGHKNPLNVLYGKEKEKSSVLGTLDNWIKKETAIQYCKNVPREELWQLKSASTNLRIAYRYRTEGIIEI